MKKTIALSILLFVALSGNVYALASRSKLLRTNNFYSMGWKRRIRMKVFREKITDNIEEQSVALDRVKYVNKNYRIERDLIGNGRVSSPDKYIYDHYRLFFINGKLYNKKGELFDTDNFFDSASPIFLNTFSKTKEGKRKYVAFTMDKYGHIYSGLPFDACWQMKENLKFSSTGYWRVDSGVVFSVRPSSFISTKKELYHFFLIFHLLYKEDAADLDAIRIRYQQTAIEQGTIYYRDYSFHNDGERYHKYAPLEDLTDFELFKSIFSPKITVLSPIRELEEST